MSRGTFDRMGLGVGRSLLYQAELFGPSTSHPQQKARRLQPTLLLIGRSFSLAFSLDVRPCWLCFIAGVCSYSSSH